MKLNYFYVLSVTTAMSLVCVDSLAANPILDALTATGTAPTVMTDEQLGTIKGTALQQIYNISAPSVLMGVKEHHVTYLKFGSTADYRSFRYVGFSYDPKAAYLISNGGSLERGVGDSWMADFSSSAYSWNRATSHFVEYHLQALTQSGQRLPYGYRDAMWNRPISKFSW